MAKIETDGDLVRIAEQIDGHMDKIRDLIHVLENSGHPLAQQFIERLEDNGIPSCAWATHAVSHSLIHPERWETGDYGIRHVNKAMKG